MLKYMCMILCLKCFSTLSRTEKGKVNEKKKSANEHIDLIGGNAGGGADRGLPDIFGKRQRSVFRFDKVRSLSHRSVRVR